MRALALDRVAGSMFLLCAAISGIWLVGQVMPRNLLEAAAVTESAQAAAAVPEEGIQRRAIEAAAGPMSSADIRNLQSRLKSLGYDPGPIDGIAGLRTLDALNQYRATRYLSRVAQVDRRAATGLLD